MRIALAVASATLLIAQPAVARGFDPVALVDPFVGTAGDHGQLSPAAVGPYGMVQLGPDTVPRQHNGYNFTAPELSGFSHTRAVGVGCGGAGGDLHVSVGYAGEGPRWRIDKASERAGPGWYRVRFGSGIVADLAAIGQGGVARFTVPRAGTVRVVVDLAHAYSVRHSAVWESRNASALAGRMSAGTVCDKGVYHLSFASRLTLNDRPVMVQPTRLPGGRVAFDLPVGAGDAVTLRSALSVVDTASARRTLDAVIGNRGVAAVRALSAAAWRRELSRVRVEGEGERERLLYTHLFRVLQTPVRIDDADGRYRRSDGTLRAVPRGHGRYAGWAIWDNYRTQLPLLALLDPVRAQDIAASLAELYSAGKTQWSTATEPFITVRTEHAGVALLDFRRKGIAGWDARTVLPLMAREIADLPRATPDQRIETAYDSWAVAELARDLGDAATERRFRADALDYRAMWLATFRDLGADADTVKARGLYQGTLWQYRWAPVFDLDWLVRTALGRARALVELDRFFAGGLFNMTNQPDVHVPFLYAYLGAPDRTAALVDVILHRPTDHWYTNEGKRPSPWRGRAFALDPAGYADGMDDDAGGMAAWYVWASLGLYPLVPGEPLYVLTTPSFARIRITPAGAPTVEIRRVAAPAWRARWNGAALAEPRLPHELWRRGGMLEIAAPKN